jgi:hypothetical protein
MQGINYSGRIDSNNIINQKTGKRTQKRKESATGAMCLINKLYTIITGAM